MRLKILRNLGKDLPPHKEGDVVDVEDKIASEWVSLGYAEAEDPEQMMAVKQAEESRIAAAKQAEEAAAAKAAAKAARQHG